MQILKRLLGYLRKYWYLVLAALICTLIGTVLNLAMPWLLKEAIDRTLVQKEYRLLGVLALSIVGVSILRGAFSFGQTYLSEYVGQKAIYDIRNAMYVHLQRLSFSFYDTAQTGQLMSRVTSDVDTLRRFLSFGGIQLVSSALTFISILVICLWMNWRLALVALSTSPFLVVTVLRFSGKVRPAFMDIRQRFADMTAALQENITGVQVVKTFAREEYEVEKFSGRIEELRQKRLYISRLFASYFPFMNFIAGIGTAFILWYGGWQIIREQLTLGELVAFNAYLMLLVGPIRMLGFIVAIWQMAIAAGERIFEIVDTRSEVEESPNAVELPKLEGHVRFEKVSFQYEDNAPVLRNVSLDVRPGGMLALLGATGSGKSTIINLIPRFYDPSEGRITVDDIDLRDAKLESLRRQIGIVLQETFLFSGTIRENIAYGRADASLDEIVKVAQIAKIHEFVESLSDGYETKVGERGVTLSGGQKQRVAIARALLMDPRILILDDSTSSVDAETEHLIQQAMAALMEGRTTFVIAQRLSTVKNADQIVVLRDGEIAEEGTHDELLALGGIYTDIYNTQFTGEQEQEEYAR